VQQLVQGHFVDFAQLALAAAVHGLVQVQPDARGQVSNVVQCAAVTAERGAVTIRRDGRESDDGQDKARPHQRVADQYGGSGNTLAQLAKHEPMPRDIVAVCSPQLRATLGHWLPAVG
jgi:hypothetical protein